MNSTDRNQKDDAITPELLPTNSTAGVVVASAEYHEWNSTVDHRPIPSFQSNIQKQHNNDVDDTVSSHNKLKQQSDNTFSTTLDKYLSHSSEEDLSSLHYTVREYLTERRKRKTQYGMCCVCFDCSENLLGHCIPKRLVYYSSFCCLRMPIIDFLNENVFYQFVVWFLFARLYFSAIYTTRIWQWFSDDRMDRILSVCDSTNQSLGASGLSTVLVMIGMIWSVALLNHVVKLSFLKRVCSLIFVLAAVVIDIAETGWSINCYHNNLFSIEIIPKSYPYLNPGQSNFTFVNVTLLTESPQDFIQLLNVTSKSMIYNIQQSQYQFISAFLILQWILAFGSAVLVVFLLLSLIVQFNFKSLLSSKNNWFNFYNYRLSRYYFHVRLLLTNISKKRTKRSFIYYTSKNSQQTTETSANSTNLSSLETDEIQDRLDEKIEMYWENKKKSVFRRLMVVPWMKLKYYFKLKSIVLKRFLSDYSREKWANFFFSSRFIVGISSALLVSMLILGTFSAFSVNVIYSAINIIYLLLVGLFCALLSNNSDSCQATLTNILIPILKVIEVNYYLAVSITIITMLAISALIAKNYKQQIESYRNGTLQFSLKSESIIKASNYPGLQAAHYAVATAVYFFIIYFILLVIGFFCLYIKEIFYLIGFLFEHALDLLLRIVSFFAGKLITVVMIFVLRFIFLRKRGTWLVHTSFFSVMDLILMVANYFYGFLTALIISTVKTVAFALINYVRLDSPGNPAFYAYAGMLKADAHNTDPIINVFADILKMKAKEKEGKMLQTLQDEPQITLANLKTKSNPTTQQPKLKNYLKLIALLSKNQQLAQHRTSMTSEFFNEESLEIKRIKLLRK